MAMNHLRPMKARSTSRTTTVTLLLGLLALGLSVVAQQDVPPLEEQLNILYSDADNVEVANEYLIYNTCHISKTAQSEAVSKYAYLGFVPIDATVNFYKDDNCQDFAFGLVGHYPQYPGPARSIKWVGRDRDNIGVYFNTALPLTSKEGFGDGDGGAGQKPPNPKEPTKAPDTKEPSQPSGDNGSNDKTDQPKEDETFMNFVGTMVGSAIVLSIGGTIVWMTVGRKIFKSSAGKSLDKGKGVLPSYSRTRGHLLSDGEEYDDVQGDEHIRLTSSRIQDHEEVFEIGDGDDIESNDGYDDDAEDSFMQQRAETRSKGKASTGLYHDLDHSGDEDVADDDSNDTQPLN
ncbi:hypothetical protein BGZ73_001687 [Actinomortierella ambigua]|nr:hypothetical protein BGZ73_001687 [Actinomortierella ambigua]